MTPTLIMICGMAGAGKTSLAKQLEQTRQAYRLCPDAWLKTIIKDESDTAELDRLRDPVEILQWQVARRLLGMGVTVILENGFWSSDERERFRREAKELGARVELQYLEVPKQELWRRIERRNAGSMENEFRITRDQLDEWCSVFTPPTPDELDRYDAHAIIRPS